MKHVKTHEHSHSKVVQQWQATLPKSGTRLMDLKRTRNRLEVMPIMPIIVKGELSWL